MNFLAPLFLAGAAAVALPVLFHLIRRSTRERTPFSSLLLLQPTPPRMRRRSRLEDILLLLLRCAVLALLALGFARPFLRDPSLTPPATSASQRVVLLIDTSASMQRGGLWNAAVDQAGKTARSLAPGDHLALLAFDRETRPLITFDAWHATPADQRAALVTSTLRDLRPGWSATLLAHALIHAAESLAERSDDPSTLIRRIVLVSDLQEGARVDPLQAYDWPKGITVSAERLAPSSRPGNASLHLLSDPAANPGATSTIVRVRVQSTPDAASGRLELGWLSNDGTSFAGRPESLTLAAGASRVLPLTVPTNLPVPVDRIALRGDAEPFDNTVFVVPPIPINTRILYAGDDSADDPTQPLYFLRRAFPATNSAAATLTPRRTTEPFSADDAASALIIATAALPPPPPPSPPPAPPPRATILFAPRSADPTTAATLGTLLGRDPVALEEVQPRSYAMLGELDFRHPLLAAFANPKFSDFTKVHFWRHRRFDTNALAAARVIARFDSGDPAWVEFPAGRGRVFLFAAGWHPADSQLALSTKFVPLLFALLESTGANPALAPRAYTVGDLIPLPEPASAQARLRLPDGSEQSLAPGSTNLARTDLPGIYTLTGTPTGSSGASSNRLRFAVNLDPSESRTLPMAIEDLERLGVAFRESATDSQPTPERAAELAATEVEGRQKLWRWFILATLAFVFLESALAGWITRRSASPTPPAA